MTLMLGLRADHHNDYGLFITPRIHFRYELGESTTLRASIGKGYRSPNILAENSFLLASSREMVIEEDLKQEEALNMGLNLTHYFEVLGKELRLTGEVYRTSFVHQVVVDLDSRSDRVFFRNLEGKSFSNVLQVESQYQILRGWDMTAAFRWNDVRTTIAGDLRSKPLTSRYKGLITTSYQTPLKKWQFDYTVQFNGDGRIPDLGTHPEAAVMGTHFDAFTVMNAQITKYFRRGSFYVGVENLTDFRQKHAILGADDPFGSHFDGSLVWGPIHGRKFYAGLRFAIDRDLSTVQ
jgi:outer membrane receptor for ferrienterochelin and colicin